MLLSRTLIHHHELDEISHLVTVITSLLTEIIFLHTKIFIFVEIYLVEKCIRVQHIKQIFLSNYNGYFGMQKGNGCVNLISRYSVRVITTDY